MLRLDPDGWLRPARHLPSANFNQRPAGTPVELVVIHNISLPPGRFGGGNVEALFTNTLDSTAHPAFADLEGLRVSAHLFIDRRGRLTQFVSLHDRAWHAGLSAWCGRENCNDFSIGIELEGTDTRPYTQRQYQRLARLIRLLWHHFPKLGADSIVGHCDIAPGRKSDPGPAFDWSRLHQLLEAS
ncbi:MAG: 1,6-anhydro-N-acetylmuramyl-L-alanine amidase AmpD [Spongiibacteraceae bacterium]|jgi:AmpD protein|nr:1,6-anhydro-N-acetylmuramyl-L-alanine amidase AmpD [Spongiibacteraceae bacterium]